MPLTRRTILQAALALPVVQGQSSDTPETVDVPAGSFTMGDRDTRGNQRNLDDLNFNGVCVRKYGLDVGPDGRVPGWRAFTETPPYRELVDRGGFTTPVDAFPAGKSRCGAYDMAGNAWEWWPGLVSAAVPSPKRMLWITARIEAN